VPYASWRFKARANAGLAGQNGLEELDSEGVASKKETL